MQFKLFTIFLIWFISGVVIHFQLWLVDMTVADRWFYFPMIGFLGLLALSCSHLHITNPLIKKTTYMSIAIIITLLSVRTIVRNIDWQTRLGLYRHNISYSDNVILYRLLEEEYLRRNDLANATTVLNKLLLLDPPNPYYLFYKAEIAQKNGNLTQSKEYYEHLLDTQYETSAYQSLIYMAINQSNNYHEARSAHKRGNQEISKQRLSMEHAS